MSTSALTAEYRDSTWCVIDPDGGVWWPSPDAAREIESAEDPASAAVQMCDTTPMRGRWHD